MCTGRGEDVSAGTRLVASSSSTMDSDLEEGGLEASSEPREAGSSAAQGAVDSVVESIFFFPSGADLLRAIDPAAATRDDLPRPRTVYGGFLPADDSEPDRCVRARHEAYEATVRALDMVVNRVVRQSNRRAFDEVCAFARGPHPGPEVPTSLVYAGTWFAWLCVG